MTRAAIRVVLSGALVCMTAAVTLAQTTTTTETKKFQVIAVDGNQLVVKLPEGTRELTVPDDFRFNVDGKMLSVHELKPGMAGTATITTKTTVTPVTVTEVKNGTVMQAWARASSFAPTGHQDVLAERHRQARRQDHARRQARADLGLPCQRPADGDHHHVEAAPGPDREGSAGDARQERWAGGAGTPAPRRSGASAPLPARASSAGKPTPHVGAGARARRDLGRCAEEAAEDRQPAAGSWPRRLRFARCGVGPHRQAASRDALAIRSSTPGRARS